MRALLQRVLDACVTVEGKVTGSIGPGVLVFVGVTHSDDVATADELARKVYELRILRGEVSVATSDGAMILAVSQFTLYADTSRGRRPSWSAAAPGSIAEPLFERFISSLRERGATVETGVFGADMTVALTNDGPVTLLIEV